MKRTIYTLVFIGIMTFLGSFGVLNSQSQGLPVSNFEGQKLYHQLKEGVLLVKLNSEQKRIEASRLRGDEKRVKYWEKKVKKEHDAIIAAFTKHYKFSEYYFYLDYNSSAILKEKDFSVLMDANGSKIEHFDFNRHVFLLYLERPSYMPTVDTYSYGFYCFEDGKVKEVNKPFKKYHTMKAVNLFKVYDFNRGIDNLNEFLSEKSI